MQSNVKQKIIYVEFYWLQKRHKNNFVKNIDITYKSVSQDAANMENVDEMPDDLCEDENLIGEYQLIWKHSIVG